MDTLTTSLVRVWLGITCAAGTVSCLSAEVEPGDEHFMVTHEGASMPVWVTGNWRSNRILVHVHGGPGTTNAIYWQKESYQRIAEQWGIAYYEQRASGNALGNRRDGRINVAQYIEDLHVVMDVLEYKYPDAEFVIMGHSWGGFLVPAFLLKGGQERVVGFIEMNGAHNASCESWNYGRDAVLQRAQQELDDSPNRRERKLWNDAIDFYADVWKCDPVTNENNQIEIWKGQMIHFWHSTFIREADGYDVDPERVLNGAETAELVLESQWDMLAVNAHSPLPMEDYYGVDLTPRFSEIEIPTLILWGVHDLITPFFNAELAFDALGTPAEDRFYVAFEDSGHNPWAEEPEKFYDAMASFLEHVWPPAPDEFVAQ